MCEWQEIGGGTNDFGDEYSSNSGNTTGISGDVTSGGGNSVITSPVGMSPQEILNKKFQKHISNINNTNLNSCYSDLNEHEKEVLMNFLIEELNENDVLENNFNEASQLILESCSSGKSLVALIIESEIKTQLSPCTQSVFNKILNLQNNDFAKILDKFSITPFSTIRGFDVTIKNGFLNNNTLAKTTWMEDVNSYPIPFNYQITISDYANNNSTDLLIAELIIHEFIHAYFTCLIDDCYALGECGQLTQFNDLWNYFSTNVYGGGIQGNLSDHEQMANLYVNIIASCLQEFHTNIAPQNDSQILQDYKDLAWSGLLNTQAFNGLNLIDKNRIINRYQIEQNNLPINNVNPIGNRISPCN